MEALIVVIEVPAAQKDGVTTGTYQMCLDIGFYGHGVTLEVCVRQRTAG